MTPYTLTEDQIVAAQRAHWLQGLRKPRRVLLLGGIALAAVAAKVINGGLSGFYEALGFIALFSVAFPIVFIRFVLRKHARKLLATAPNFQGLQHVRLDADGMTVHNAVGSWHQRWTAFRGCRVLPQTVSLYVSDQSFHVLPRAALERGELEVITSHLPDIRGRRP